MGERRLSSEEARRMAALRHQARREQFEDQVGGLSAIPLYADGGPLRFVYPDEWTTPSALEVSSWED